MLVVSTREFRAKQKDYLDKIDNGTQIIIQRGANKSYKITPVSDDDLLLNIPLEFRSDPFDISPSGDIYWADKRNIDDLDKRIKASKNTKNTTELKTKKDITNFLNCL